MLTPVLTVNIVWYVNTSTNSKHCMVCMYILTPVLTVNIVWYVNTSTNSKRCMVCQHQF